MRPIMFAIPVFFGLAACTGGDPAEVCDDDADNDSDGAADCLDPECASDAACDAIDTDSDPPDTDVDDTDDTDDTQDTDDTEDTDPRDTDDIDDSDLPDPDHETDEPYVDCETDPDLCLVHFIEIGRITATATVYEGKGSMGSVALPVDTTSTFVPGADTLCEVEFRQTGTVHEQAADCPSCDWAFFVTFSDTEAQSGPECATYDMRDPDTGVPFSVEGYAYGYGYTPVYQFGGTGPAVPSLMYYEEGIGWTSLTTDVVIEGDEFWYAYVYPEYSFY